MDLNQGMILAIPILLIVYPVLWLRELIHGIKNREFRYDLLLPFFLLAMISIFCTMINWNHGMAVINRYATWSSAVLMIHGFFMMKGLERVKQSVLLLLCFFAQVISVLYNNRYYNHYDWDQNLNKPWAEWAYENFSSLYNPDPNIFFVRTSKNYNFVPEEGPIVYLDKKGIICKTLVHKDYINKLTGWGVPASKLNDLKASKIFRTGWLYFNKGTLESTFTPDSLLSIRREERVKAIINEMPRHKDWYNSIKLKAAENNISVEEMMRRDALYLINEEKK